MTLLFAVALSTLSLASTPAPPAAPGPPAAPPALEAAFGKGVTVRTADGTFQVNARARIQVQGATSFPAPGGSPGFRTDQLLVRRTRLAVRASLHDVWE